MKAEKRRTKEPVDSLMECFMTVMTTERREKQPSCIVKWHALHSEIARDVAWKKLVEA